MDSTITAPTSVALDQTGNLYVSDMTNSTPNLFELAVTGLVNFGVGLTPTVLTQQDVPLFDIGNEPLDVYKRQGNGSLYQLSPGATSWSTLVDGTAATPGIFGTGYSAIGMAIDAQGTLYFTIRYEPKFVSDALFWRVPYNASQNTWQPTASNGWGGNIFDAQGDQLYSYGSDDVEWVDNPAMDGSGTLYWMAETQNNIYSLAVDKTGNASQTSVKANAIVTGLKADQGKLAIDVNGNIYFTENRAVKNTARVNGIFFIPAGTTGLTGTGDGDVEATLQLSLIHI